MKRLLPPVLCTLAAVAATAGPAAAATVSKVGSEVTYRAAPREVNRVEMRTPFAPIFPFFEYSATLTAGENCTGTFPVVCQDGAGGIPTVTLGDRDDVAFIDSFSGSPRVYGEAGDDDIWSGGNVETFAYGGAGADTLRLNTDGAGVGLGGSGDDRIGSNGSVQDDLQGEGGDDLLASKARAGRLSGGSGRDELVEVEQGSGTLDGGSGPDVLVAPNGFSVIGGTGADTIKAHGTIDAGSGTDVIDATDEQEGMAPDTVTCGSGFDLVWASAEDTVAADCEFVLRKPAPTLPFVASAQAAAAELLAHRPDPSQP
jgi:Ca2+-binding RTX toxin-like protein